MALVSPLDFFPSREEDISYSDGLNTSTGSLASDIRNFNSSEALISRNWSAYENQLNREFQERMSNTAYQRAAADIRAAGFNPAIMFAKGFGPASTPTGSTIAGGSASQNLVSADTRTGMISANSQFLASLSGTFKDIGKLIEAIPGLLKLAK